MALDAGSRKVLGIVAIAGGIGGGVYLYNQYSKGRKVASLTVGLPANPTAVSGQVFQLPAAVSNPGSATIVAAQGTIYSPSGIVTGHFWSSPQALALAIAEYDAGDLQGYAAYSLTAQARIASAQAAQGSQATLYLYTDPGAVGPLSFIVWVGVSPSGLLVQDPLGKPLPANPSGVVGYRGTLQVS